MDKDITLFADSRVISSLICADELPHCKRSGRYIDTIGAAGVKTNLPHEHVKSSGFIIDVTKDNS